MIVETDNGKIDGNEKEGYLEFLGIPYGAPPIGERRFLPPVKPRPWNWVWETKKLGHASVQLFVTGLSHFELGETISEDCLYLNVTTPSLTGKRPVLVWIHGGAFQKGSAPMGLRASSFMKDDIVVVGINYRLGALGFMDVSGVLGDTYRESGNNGILDVLLALRWVKKNIASFGGDPDNVTLMGQSAGAKIVSTLSLMKTAKGLFHKVIACSGAVQAIRDRHTAWVVADRFMQEAHISKDNPGALLTMTGIDVLAAQKVLFAGLNLHTVGPVFDGVNFDGDAALPIIRSGAARGISFLMGTNRDEMNLYWYVYHFHDLTPASAERLFGTRAPLIWEEYQKIPHDKDFQMNFVHFLTEYVYRMGTVDMAGALSDAGSPVYLYQLDWDHQQYKACHGNELQFVTGKCPYIVDIEKSEAHDRLTRQMRGAFISFIRDCRPEQKELAPWDDFSTRRIMVFDEESRMEPLRPLTVRKDMPYQVFKL